MEHVKLLSMTALLTVLIWIVADSLINEPAVLEPDIVLTPAQGVPNLLVERVEDVDYRVHVVGPRRELDRIEAARPLNIQLEVAEQEDGVVSLDLKDLISQQWGDYPRVAVVSVDPPTIRAKIDHWSTVTVPVVPRRFTLDYESPPQIEPSQVTLRMPGSLLRELRAKNPELQLDVDVEQFLRDHGTGEPIDINIPLDGSAFGAGVTVTPARVRVTATIRLQRVTRQVLVPLRFVISPGVLGRPEVLVHPNGEPITLLPPHPFTVNGPPEVIRRIESGDIKLEGLIRLKAAHLEEPGVVRVFTPELFIPPGQAPGIELAETPGTVEFRVKTADSPAP